MIKKADTSFDNEELTKKELQDAFQCLQSNQSPRLEEISSNNIKNIFENI